MQSLIGIPIQLPHMQGCPVANAQARAILPTSRRTYVSRNPGCAPGRLPAYADIKIASLVVGFEMNKR